MGSSLENKLKLAKADLVLGTSPEDLNYIIKALEESQINYYYSLWRKYNNSYAALLENHSLVRYASCLFKLLVVKK